MISIVVAHVPARGNKTEKLHTANIAAMNTHCLFLLPIENRANIVRLNVIVQRDQR